MIQLKAYKYRIYPTEEQKIFISKTFGCVRLVYNLMLNDRDINVTKNILAEGLRIRQTA